ncbi:MAG TPA: type II toxin-antitoxin system VapC family toxin [Stellaceae bacterium]|nr:type II toxin-antitoxin system VapC family toxin [Stellaceae bacterium]
MIIDTSAIIAILFAERDAGAFAAAIEAAAARRMSAANFLETAIVVDGRGDPVIRRRFEDFMREAVIVVEPVDLAQVAVAREAYRDFGKRSGHPAQLNFGDCFAYALARQHGETLLFKGNDFLHTDITSALP